MVAALLGLVAFTIAGIAPGSSGRLEHASAGWLALGVLLELTAIAAYALLFHGVFSYPPYRLRPLRSAQIAAGELAGYVVSPTGAGGPALRIWALLRSRFPFREVMTRSVVHAAAFNLPYIAAAATLGAGALLGLGVGHARTVLALAPAGVVVVSGALVLAAMYLARRPARPASGWRRLARDALEAIPAGLAQLPVRLREPLVVPPAIAYWVCDWGVLVAAVHAVHGSAPIAVIALAYMLGQLGNAVPLPGGVGGVEPVMVGVLTASGVSLAVAGAAVVLYRFISLGLQATVGALAIGSLIPSLQRERASDVTRGLGPSPG